MVDFWGVNPIYVDLTCIFFYFRLICCRGLCSKEWQDLIVSYWDPCAFVVALAWVCPTLE